MRERKQNSDRLWSRNRRAEALPAPEILRHVPRMKGALPISERELWACAYKVIDSHGAGAELQAAMRADELLAEGDIAGQRVWKAILARIEEWLSEDRPPMRQ